MSQATHSVAIAHGQLTSDGGAERVAIQLARTFDAPIYAAEVDPEFVPYDVEAHEVFTGRAASLIYGRQWKPRAVYYMLKHLYTAQRASWVEELHDYDTIIINKGEMAWYVPKPDQTVVRYLHSTPRRMFDQYHRRGDSAKVRLWTTLMRTLQQPTANYPDRIVCNSDTVRRRVKKYWRASDDRLAVVYPGVDTRNYGSHRAETGDFVLVLGRLAKNKRTPLVREVAEATDRRIVVAGDGPERPVVEDGPPNLEAVGYVDEPMKQRLLSAAEATLFVGEQEDFGIVPIESFASGTPVIGADEGFTRHQIQDGLNGYRCEPTVEGVQRAFDRFDREGVEWPEQVIERYAQQFDWARFSDDMQAVVAEARETVRVDPDLEVPQEAIASAD